VNFICDMRFKLWNWDFRKRILPNYYHQRKVIATVIRKKTWMKREEEIGGDGVCVGEMGTWGSRRSQTSPTQQYGRNCKMHPLLTALCLSISTLDQIFILFNQTNSHSIESKPKHTLGFLFSFSFVLLLN